MRRSILLRAVAYLMLLQGVLEFYVDGSSPRPVFIFAIGLWLLSRASVTLTGEDPSPEHGPPLLAGVSPRNGWR
jgi:hypothetical protein